jgi:hypothetical protein
MILSTFHSLGKAFSTVLVTAFTAIFADTSEYVALPSPSATAAATQSFESSTILCASWHGKPASKCLVSGIE